MNAGAQFEIVVDGKPHTYRDLKEIALESAIHHKTRFSTHDGTHPAKATGQLDFGWAAD